MKDNVGKMKNLVKEWTTGLKGWLRNRLDALPPKARLGMILAAFAVFASLCLYMTAAAIIGSKREEALEIQHIEKLEIYNKVYHSNLNHNGKLSDWIWEKMENLQDAGFRWKPTLKFCTIQVLRLDYNAIAGFHRKERASPAITRARQKILWDYRFFRNLDQTERRLAQGYGCTATNRLGQTAGLVCCPD